MRKRYDPVVIQCYILGHRGSGFNQTHQGLVAESVRCWGQVLANFGDAPFKADVETMKSDAAQRLGVQIAQTELPERGKVRCPYSGVVACRCMLVSWRY